MEPENIWRDLILNPQALCPRVMRKKYSWWTEQTFYLQRDQNRSASFFHIQESATSKLPYLCRMYLRSCKKFRPCFQYGHVWQLAMLALYVCDHRLTVNQLAKSAWLGPVWQRKQYAQYNTKFKSALLLLWSCRQMPGIYLNVLKVLPKIHFGGWASVVYRPQAARMFGFWSSQRRGLVTKMLREPLICLSWSQRQGASGVTEKGEVQCPEKVNTWSEKSSKWFRDAARPNKNVSFR